MLSGKLDQLDQMLEGDLKSDEVTRTLYATDASVYKEMPLAVAYPAGDNDLVTLVRFAIDTNIPLIPRAAGTSLAGQVVGNGLVVDVSRHMTRMLEFNPDERWIWVQPGVVLDELNAFLAPHQLFFAPETSTANRCMIGGMLGNNACGLHSLVYGSTREHTLAVRAVLSDSTQVEIGELSLEELHKKQKQNDLEGKIYKYILQLLDDPENRAEIRNNYPDPSIPRRNTGYALDIIAQMRPFSSKGPPFNLARLLAGSEGTLTLFTAIKLQLVDIPPPYKAVVCAHFTSIQETLQGNLVALRHQPTAVELMDSVVLSCTKSNRLQEENRFFVVGDPRAILIIEFAESTPEELDEKISGVVRHLQERNLGYAFPVVPGKEIKRVWNLRKAGLGLLANLPGDAKSVTVIEDTAVPVENLPAYIAEMEALFEEFGMTCVYHAHVGTGELHLRPVLDLKNPEDVVRFRQIATATVPIVKKYRGSFSGEHGDGRLRSEFIRTLLGDANYKMMEGVKKVFDPQNLFNPGKIIDPVCMDQNFRTTPGQPTPDLTTYFDWSDTHGVVRAAEKCNGSGDCRKSHLIGGTMCPSYQATRDERNSTRARANILREYLNKPMGRNGFDHPEIKEILDLCLSCKACKSECPSSVDMAKLKAEFLQNWYDVHGIPLRSRLIGEIPHIFKMGMLFPALFNSLASLPPFRWVFNRISGFSPMRSLPKLSHRSLSGWYRQNRLKVVSSHAPTGKLYLYVDEFTNYTDADIGVTTLLLLTRLGYSIEIVRQPFSARTYLSKGMLKKAKRIVRHNIQLFKGLIDVTTPLVGIEPSAILGFRDEFPDLAGDDLRQDAIDLGTNVMLLDEFLAREMKAGRIGVNQFTGEKTEILVHGHCQQKAVASTDPTLFILNFPENYSAHEIPSGCCGMAGSFGFEKGHYDLSMKVGELVLFPAVREASPDTLIAAPGTSCRHHIYDGTGKRALHPVEILYQALITRPV